MTKKKCSRSCYVQNIQFATASGTKMFRKFILHILWYIYYASGSVKCTKMFPCVSNDKISELSTGMTFRDFRSSPIRYWGVIQNGKIMVPVILWISKLQKKETKNYFSFFLQFHVWIEITINIFNFVVVFTNFHPIIIYTFNNKHSIFFKIITKWFYNYQFITL